MSRLVVTATSTGSKEHPLMFVSVSAADDGRPVKNLEPSNFEVHYLAINVSMQTWQTSESMASSPCPISGAVERPAGFYVLTLSPQQTTHQGVALGHHFTVAVTSRRGEQVDHGQTQVVYAAGS